MLPPNADHLFVSACLYVVRVLILHLSGGGC